MDITPLEPGRYIIYNFTLKIEIENCFYKS